MTPPYRTVLIDDHRLFSNGMNLILGSSPLFSVVEQVYDSRMALEVCDKHRPDLVLIDYNMPHLNGAEVVGQLRQLKHECRLVIVSMYAETREIARFKTVCIDGFLAKTLPADLLLVLLERIMQGERVIEADLPAPAFAAPPDALRLYHQLTKREVQILKSVKKGLTTEQIAEQLRLSFFTVQTHRKNIARKLPFTTQKELYDFLDLLEE